MKTSLMACALALLGAGCVPPERSPEESPEHVKQAAISMLKEQMRPAFLDAFKRWRHEEWQSFDPADRKPRLVCEGTTSKLLLVADVQRVRGRNWDNLELQALGISPAGRYFTVEYSISVAGNPPYCDKPHVAECGHINWFRLVTRDEAQVWAFKADIPDEDFERVFGVKAPPRRIPG